MPAKSSFILVALGFVLGTIFVDQTVPDCPTPAHQAAPSVAPPTSP